MAATLGGVAALAWAAMATAGCPNPDCPADLNGDLVVHGADLGILLGAWGSNDPCADLNGNGVVDGGDLGILLGAWGPCPVVAICPDSDHDCYTTGGPGCTDIDCCEVVCAADAFCCETAWDGLCVNGAVALCGPPDRLECSPGATPEGEPCGSDTNGGCNSVPPIFGAIACGESICGNAWAVGGTRDTDWYQITLNRPTEVTFSISNDIPMVIGIVDTGGIADCSLATQLLPFATSPPLGSASFTTCLNPGTYWFFAGPNGFEGFPCNGGASTYEITLECVNLSEPCPGVCEVADHDCCTTGGPGCTTIECCEIVCAADPFCCEVAWDAICVGLAQDLCPGGCEGGATCDRVLQKLDRAIAKLDRAIVKVKELVQPVSPGQIEPIVEQIQGVIDQLEAAIVQLQPPPPDCVPGADLQRVIDKLEQVIVLLKRAIGKLQMLQDPRLPPQLFESIRQQLLFQLQQAIDLLDQAIMQLEGAPPQLAIFDVFPLTAGAGDLLTIVGQGFPVDADLVCALAVPQVGGDAFGPQPLLAQGLRVISATPDTLVARVSGVAPWTTSGQIMIAVGDGSTDPMPPGIPPSLTVLAPGAWTWQANGGPTAVSPQSVDFVTSSLVTCTAFYGQVVNGQLRITISGNSALCPTGTTLTLQADVATTTQQWVIDQFIQVQTNQPLDIVQCVSDLCSAVQTILFQATGQFFPCNGVILGPNTIELIIGAPFGQQWDPNAPQFFWMQICVP